MRSERLIPLVALCCIHLGQMALRAAPVELREPGLRCKNIAQRRGRNVHMLGNQTRSAEWREGGMLIVQTERPFGFRPLRVPANHVPKRLKRVFRLTYQFIAAGPPPSRTTLRRIHHRQCNVPGITRVDLNSNASGFSRTYHRPRQPSVSLDNNHAPILGLRQIELFTNDIPKAPACLDVCRSRIFAKRQRALIKPSPQRHRAAEFARQCRARFWHAEANVQSWQVHQHHNPTKSVTAGLRLSNKKQPALDRNGHQRTILLDATSPTH